MANILYANNAAGTLAAPITNTSVALTLNVGQAALFPVPASPQVFYVTLTDAATQSLIEIVQVTAVAGNIFSIVRGQDGTLAQSWNTGDIVSLRTIRLELQGFENAAEGIFTTVQIQPSSTQGIKGTVTNDNANPGSVGEFMDSGVLGPFTVASNAIFNAGTINLPAGDWDVETTALFQPSPGGTFLLDTTVGLSNVLVFDVLGTFTTTGQGAASAQIVSVTPTVRKSLAVGTPVNMLVTAVTVDSSAFGVRVRTRARRVR